MTRDLVTIKDLRVTLSGNPILKGVNAGLARGSVTALIGLNGAGKSTLLRALVKEVPYSGRIEFHCGHDHSRPNPDHVGYVPQRLRIEANLPLTVYDLFTLALQRRPLFFGATRQGVPPEVNVLATALLVIVLVLMGLNVLVQRRLARRDVARAAA